MKRKEKALLILVLVIMTVFTFGCNTKDSTQKDTMEKFIVEKAKLYNKKDKITHLFNTMDLSLVDKWDEVFKNIKEPLTEEAFERSIYNRSLLSAELLDGTYDQAKIDGITFEKISESGNTAVYQVQYVEKLYLDKKLKKEEQRITEFTLEDINRKWLISEFN